MQQQPIVEFRHIKRTEALLNHIELNLHRLAQFSHDIISCHIIIELVQHNQHTGNLYGAKIILGLPGKELIVCHNHEENLYVAIQDGFSVMQIQLNSRMEKMHHHVKHHTEVNHGEVVRLDYSNKFGFIRDAAGNEFYFNQDSVTTHHPLNQGDTVEFHEFSGYEGAQAHHVRPSKYYKGEMPYEQ